MIASFRCHTNTKRIGKYRYQFEINRCEPIVSQTMFNLRRAKKKTQQEQQQQKPSAAFVISLHIV